MPSGNLVLGAVHLRLYLGELAGVAQAPRGTPLCFEPFGKVSPKSTHEIPLGVIAQMPNFGLPGLSAKMDYGS